MQCVGPVCIQPLRPSGVHTLFKNLYSKAQWTVPRLSRTKSPQLAELELLKGLLESIQTWKGVIPAIYPWDPRLFRFFWPPADKGTSRKHTSVCSLSFSLVHVYLLIEIFI